MCRCRWEVLLATLLTLLSLGHGQETGEDAALNPLLRDGDDLAKRPTNLGLAFAGLGKRNLAEQAPADSQLSSFDPGEKRYYNKGLQYAGLGKRFNPGMQYAGLGKRFNPGIRFTGIGKREDAFSADAVNKRFNPGLTYTGLGKRYNENILAQQGLPLDSEAPEDKRKRYSSSVLYAGLGKRNYFDKRLSHGAEERYGLHRAHYRRGGRINPAVAFAGIGKRSAHS